MEIVIKFILDIFILLLIDIILSVDNAVLISMSTKELKGKDRKIASLFGAMGAVLLRLIFVILLIFFIEQVAEIPVIYIVGGLLLAVIGWTITKEHNKKHGNVKSSQKVLKAIAIIIAGDIMMSFDNALIISEVVVGIEWGFQEGSHWIGATLDLLIVAIALLISLMLIVFSSNVISNFMEKNRWVVYVGCWLLMSVGIEMIFKDALIHDLVENKELIVFFTSYALGAAVTGANWYWRKIHKAQG